ncbi:MAG: transcriptional regulator [Cephaloticoccus sp.]|nr:transcriptional regulator [Cephaloticoccus sp.]
MPELDSTIHQPVRLQIMAALCNLKSREQVDFTFLKDKLDLTDGNLGAHLTTLEEAGYIAIEKAFIARRPKTFAAATAKGRMAFTSHVEALQSILRANP